MPNPTAQAKRSVKNASDILGRHGIFATGSTNMPDAIVLDAASALRIAVALSLASERLNALMKGETGPAVPQLTPRQREILAWVARGKSNSVIGEILGISGHTVDTHMRRIFEKLETTDRIVASIRAIQLGLVTDGELTAA